MLSSTSKLAALAILLLSSSAFAQEIECNIPNCPGVANIEGTVCACCVGGTLPTHTTTTCVGICPISVPVVTIGPTKASRVSCATNIPSSVSNFDALMSSASSSLSQSGTQIQTTLPTGGKYGTTAISTSLTAAAASTTTSAAGAVGLTMPLGAVGGALLMAAGML